MPLIQQSFYLLNARSIFVIFSVIDGLLMVFYFKGMWEKVKMQRTHQFSDFSLLSKEFQEIWQKKTVQKPHGWSITKCLNLTEEIFNNTGNVSKTSYGELQNPLSQNFIRTVLTEGILYEFVVGKWWKKCKYWISFKLDAYLRSLGLYVWEKLWSCWT